VRIRKLYAIEAEIRGSAPEVRRTQRQARSKPIVDALKPWLEESLAKISKGSKLADAIRYGLNHWDGLCRFLDDGHIEIDSNIVERSIRPIALTRKNALFAGHDIGAENWAIAASLIDLQAEQRRSIGVDDGCAHQARQPVAGIAYRGTDAVGICQAHANGSLNCTSTRFGYLSRSPVPTDGAGDHKTAKSPACC
jgi:hypothetical protein